MPHQQNQFTFIDAKSRIFDDGALRVRVDQRNISKSNHEINTGVEIQIMSISEKMIGDEIFKRAIARSA